MTDLALILKQVASLSTLVVGDPDLQRCSSGTAREPVDPRHPHRELLGRIEAAPLLVEIKSGPSVTKTAPLSLENWKNGCWRFLQSARIASCPAHFWMLHRRRFHGTFM